MRRCWKVVILNICMMAGLISGALQNMDVVQAAGETETQSVEMPANTTRKIVKKNTHFQVKTELGLNGYGTYGRPLLAKISVESDESFEGEIRMVPGTEAGITRIAQGQDVTLAAGETKEVSFVFPNAESMGSCYVQLLNKAGNVIYSEIDRITLSDVGNDIKIGILSEDDSALRYFDGVSLKIGTYEGTSGILELDEETFPEQSSVLSLLSYIVIDNYDTDLLSDQQYDALKEWVEHGGVLILATGKNYRNVLHRFDDDFVSITCGTVRRKSLAWSYLKQNLIVKDVECVDISLEDGSSLDAFSKDESALYKDVGNGKVVVLSFALGTKLFAEYEENSIMATMLLNASKSSETVDVLNGNYYDGGAYSCYNIARLTNDDKKPSEILYGIILFTYVIVVGPLLYLILKKRKQREKIWIAIPVVSLLFTGIIYVSSFLYRVNVPIVDTVSMISLQNDKQTEKVYTNLTCPKAKDYTIRLNPLYQSIEYDGNYYSGSVLGIRNGDDGRYDYLIKESTEGKELIFHNEEAFHSNTFTAVRSGENETGDISYNLQCMTTGFEGTVTNDTRYDLTGVVVTFENHIYLAGDIKTGETVQIDPSKLITSNGYGTFEKISQGITRNQKAYRYIQIDSMMESYYMRESDFQKGIIWAKIEEYQPDYVVEGKVKTSGVGIIYKTFEGEYADVKGAYYHSMEPMIEEINGDYDSSDGMLYSNELVAVYSFEEYPGITRLQKMVDNDTLTYGSYAKVFAYNVKTGNYEEIFTDSDTLSGGDFQKYVVNHQIKLLYEADDPQAEQIYIPRICARGDE